MICTVKFQTKYFECCLPNLGVKSIAVVLIYELTRLLRDYFYKIANVSIRCSQWNTWLHSLSINNLQVLFFSPLPRLSYVFHWFVNNFHFHIHCFVKIQIYVQKFTFKLKKLMLRDIVMPDVSRGHLERVRIYETLPKSWINNFYSFFLFSIL